MVLFLRDFVQGVMDSRVCFCEEGAIARGQAFAELLVQKSEYGDLRVRTPLPLG